MRTDRSSLVVPVLSCALTLALLPVAPVGASSPVAKPSIASTASARASTDSTEENRALAEARRTGQKVELVSRRTEVAQIFARPDGVLVEEQSLQPRFVEQPDGSWRNADPTLRRNADGSVAPVASTMDMRFSGGGTGPLAVFRADRASLALTWPAALPAPVLSGDTARYRDVLPGVDLEVRAGVDSFTNLLVIHSAKAAANPSLRRIRLGVEGSDVSLRTDPGTGAVSAVDSAGREVFGGPSPSMWDSRDNLPPADPDAPPLEPKRAAVGVELTAAAMTLVPDRAMLADPNVTWPLVIDPTWSKTSGARNAWTVLRKSEPSRSFYNATSVGSNDSTRGLVRAGFSNWESPTVTDRSLFNMNVSGVRYKHIYKATFSLTQQWAGAGCGNTAQPRVNLRVLNQAFNSSTVWNTGWNTSGSGWGATLAYSTAIRRYGDSCAPRRVEFNVTSRVTQLAAAGASAMYLGLRAANESDKFAWKRYKLDPGLSIEYNTRPNAPGSLKVTGKACATGSGRPYVTTPTPNFTGAARDPDAVQQSLTTRFYWWRSGQSRGGDYVQGTSANPGNPTSAAIPTAKQLVNDQTYVWQAQTIDDVNDSTFSGTCEFTVDLVDPSPPPSVTSTAYPPYSGATDPGSGGVGISGTFHVNPSPSTDVVAFAYTFDTAVVKEAAPRAGLNADKSADITFTPNAAKLYTLRVWAVDRATRFSTPKDYQFKVKLGNGPAARWQFDNTAARGEDSSGQANTLTLGSSVAYTAGRAGDASALSLNGSSNAYATRGAVTYPHPTTGAPLNVVVRDRFSVSAWVKLNATGGGVQNILSYDGNRVHSFRLAYNGGNNTWIFRIVPNDADGAAGSTIASTATATAGKWTHVAATWDTTTATMMLYVNGQLQSSHPLASAWYPHATVGTWSIGRTKADGVFKEYLNGAVDDVRVYGYAVPGTEFTEQAKPLAPVVTFVSATQVPVGGSVQVRFSNGGDTNATSFKYSVGTPTLGSSVTATAAADATVTIPATAIGTLRVYAAVVYGGSGNLQGPIANASIPVIGLPSVSGVVRDKQTGLTVAGAKVLLDPSGLSTTSAANGTYTIGGFAAGTYTVAASFDGQCGLTYRTELAIAETTTLDIWLNPVRDLFGYSCQVLPGQPFQPANTVVLPLTGDNAVAQVSLPFPMPFYGANRSTAWVDTNGIVTFEDPGGSHAQASNVPSPAQPNLMVAAYWDDLVVDGSASVRTATLGTAPFRQFVIEWRNVHRAGDTAQRVTFEAILDEQGLVMLNYTSLDGAIEQGDQAVVGIESPGGEIGIEYSFQLPTLAGSTAIAFLPDLTNTIATFDLTGTVIDADTGGPAAGVTVTLEPAGLTDTTAADGSYEFAGLESGNYTVFALSGARCAKVADLTVDVFAATDADLTLRPVADEFGYVCAEGPMAYIPASGPDDHDDGDDISWEETLPFPVKLYGSTYTTAWVNSNGLVTFKEPDGGLWDTTEIPSLAAPERPNAAVYAFWDDWVKDEQSDILHTSFGTAPNRQWVVEWRNVRFVEDPGVRVTFEVIFYENGDVAFVYADIDPASDVERGIGATVGIEDTTGTVAFQYLYAETRLVSGHGVRFHALPPGQGGVGGTVSCEGVPVAGATVSTAGQTVTTAAGGGYSIGGIASGPYSAIATLTSGACKGSSVAPVMIGTGSQAAIDFTLDAPPAGTGYTVAEQPFAFVPAATVTSLTGDDEFAPFTLPFPVVLYGQSSSTVWVDTNGVVSLAPPSESSWAPSSLPSPAAPNTPNLSIYPMWEDWVVDDQASVRTSVLNAAPNRAFVIEWRNVYAWDEPQTRVSFELILYETGGFMFAYSGQEGTFVELGGSSTIGIENADGTVALQYSYRHPALRPSTGIRFYPPTS